MGNIMELKIYLIEKKIITLKFVLGNDNKKSPKETKGGFISCRW